MGGWVRNGIKANSVQLQLQLPTGTELGNIKAREFNLLCISSGRMKNSHSESKTDPDPTNRSEKQILGIGGIYKFALVVCFMEGLELHLKLQPHNYLPREAGRITEHCIYTNFWIAPKTRLHCLQPREVLHSVNVWS